MKIQGSALTIVMAAASAVAMAHDGRRYEIRVVNDQLVAQGYISSGVDDGGGVTRPYFNALHGHWTNLASVVAATADLPGFDVFVPGPLTGFDLTATLTGATMWVNPPADPEGVVPQLIAADEEIFVTLGADTVSTVSPGTLTIATGIPAAGVVDIDAVYDVLAHPSGVIYVLSFTLSTDAPGVADSDPVYVLLSPDGANPIEKLHLQSLYLEWFLGTPVCPGDLDGDGAVGGSDLAALLAAWGSGAADLDGDGVTGGSDLAVLLAAWGDCAAS